MIRTQTSTKRLFAFYHSHIRFLVTGEDGYEGNQADGQFLNFIKFGTYMQTCIQHEIAITEPELFLDPVDDIYKYREKTIGMNYGGWGNTMNPDIFFAP